MCGWQVKLCDPIITLGPSERFRGIVYYMTKRYINSRYFYFYTCMLPSALKAFAACVDLTSRSLTEGVSNIKY